MARDKLCSVPENRDAMISSCKHRANAKEFWMLSNRVIDHVNYSKPLAGLGWAELVCAVWASWLGWADDYWLKKHPP